MAAACGREGFLANDLAQQNFQAKLPEVLHKRHSVGSADSLHNKAVFSCGADPLSATTLLSSPPRRTLELIRCLSVCLSVLLRWTGLPDRLRVELLQIRERQGHHGGAGVRHHQRHRGECPPPPLKCPSTLSPHARV